MRTEFDIQLFAEEEVAVAENSEEVVEQQADSQTEDKPPIPEELEGLEEEYARAAMQEWEEIKSQSQPKTQEEETQEEQPPTQQTDEITQLRSQVANLTAQLQQMQQPQPQSQSQPQKPPLTKEHLEKFKEAVDAVAMQMTGFSKEDIAGFEFRDDGEAMQESWNYARQIAQSKIINDIQQAQAQYIRNQQHFYQQHLQSVQSYNDFVAKEMQEKDHQQIANYAMNEYFANLNPVDQLTIRSAYDRVERQTASPADTLLVKNYYWQAKQAYRNNAQKQQTKAKTKPNVPPNLPKVDLIQGTTGNTNGIPSTAELEKMLETKAWDEIDPKYQRIMLGYKN